MSAIIKEDGIIHYEVLGHGKPVIFLHSWIGSWRYWIPSMQFASSRYRAYALDFWGFGTSKKIVSRYALEQQVELLGGFINQMGLERTTLVGHGLGSIIGTYFAADFGHLVEKLMLISFPMGFQMAHSRLQSQSPIDSANWLFGTNSDNADPREDVRKTEDLLPGTSQIHLFEESGHFPMLDEPSKFNRLLTDFINLPLGDDPNSLEIKSLWKRRVR